MLNNTTKMTETDKLLAELRKLTAEHHIPEECREMTVQRAAGLIEGAMLAQSMQDKKAG